MNLRLLSSKAIRSIVACVAIILASTFAFAQTGDRQRFDVPKTVFDKWQTVDENEDYVEYLAKFPSPYKTGYAENDMVHLVVQLPAGLDKPPPVVLILHYWGAPSLKIERSLALELNQRGIGAAILTLPYHLARTPRGAVSGAMAIQADPEKLKAVMTQAVMDSRRALDFLETRPECGRILGIYGTSLGAIVASLTYAVDDRLVNSAFLLGGIELSKIIWNSSLLVPIKDELRAKGFNEARLSAALQDIEPANYLSGSKTGKTFIVRARYDTVVPPECTDALIRLLPDSKLLEIDSGHYGGVFVQERLLREVASFFENVDKGKEYVPPARLVTPTIRVGVILEVPSHFDIAAGFDLFKFDPKGKSYASFLLTPQNPVIWIGSDISSGLNVGVGISNRRVGFGLFWSVVL